MCKARITVVPTKGSAAASTRPTFHGEARGGARGVLRDATERALGEDAPEWVSDRIAEAFGANRDHFSGKILPRTPGNRFPATAASLPALVLAPPILAP